MIFKRVQVLENTHRKQHCLSYVRGFFQQWISAICFRAIYVFIWMKCKVSAKEQQKPCEQHKVLLLTKYYKNLCRGDNKMTSGFWIDSPLASDTKRTYLAVLKIWVYFQLFYPSLGNGFTNILNTAFDFYPSGKSDADLVERNSLLCPQIMLFFQSVFSYGQMLPVFFDFSQHWKCKL